MIGEAGVTGPATRTGFTVTRSQDDVVTSFSVALSVTTAQKYLFAEDVVRTTAVNACGDVAPAIAWTKVEPEVHVEVAEEYSVAVKGDVPPDHVTVNATDWPESIDGLRGDTIGVPKIELTVTVFDAAEVVTSFNVALSVTWSSKLYVLPTTSVLPAMRQVSVAPAIAPDPLFTAHSAVAE
jgi:hypothetical protein